jgi:hypothetical protein
VAVVTVARGAGSGAAHTVDDHASGSRHCSCPACWATHTSPDEDPQ